MTNVQRLGFVVGTLLCLSVMIPLKAAPVSMFDGKPAFAEGEALSYYVWREGDTWNLRWTTFGAFHHFTGSVTAEGGKLESLKRVDVETERRVIAPGRPAHVVVGPRGRVRGVRGGTGPVVETRTQDHIDKEGDRRIVFNTRTNDDIDGFTFKVNKDVKVLRMALQIDGQPRPRMIQVGRNNTRVQADPIVVEMN
jgi:hypothetical protein